ncbi:hypothetical protein CEQ90_07655 [Lewinellaceae bacterium SD302]|nr:hypothetical protein CEQ90_07655 [Lewinellaceae bacterium SD302]
MAVAFLSLLPQQAQATHIVGGNMEYNILETTDNTVTIQVKLAVYRDCFFGDPDVYFDDPAYIGVFDQNNFLIDGLQLDFSGTDDTLDQGLDTFCLVNLSPVCVHTTFYEGTITLPIVEGGYTFAYQRCCRNQTINNIVDPLQTGATFLIRVNDAAIARANNSPKFDNFPPIYVCANEPFVFENTATDIDGDSLVYELCTPFEGGTINTPQPVPTFPPPYDTVVFAPGFSLQNLLGGNGDPLTIDSETGLMTAFPTLQGQFVIGVCIREYDRETGELLSVNRRDFQYNVNPCENITAEFEAPEVQCDDLTVLFDNISTSPPFFDWFIDGQLISNSDSFLLQDFIDTGSFNIELVAVPNTFCADTFSQTLNLVNNSIVPDFFIAALNCVDSTILCLSDLSIDTISTIDSFLWEVEINNIIIATASGPNPCITLPSDVTGTITLTVFNENNCEQTFSREFDTTSDNPTDFILAERDVCFGDTIQLNPFAPDSLNFEYLWAPADLLDDPTAQNPIAMIDESTTFSVTITNGVDDCETVLETTITLLDSPEASYDAVPECGGITYVFNNTSTNADTYFYDFGVTDLDSDTSDLANTTYTFPGPGIYTVTFVATNANGCSDTLVQDITVDVANQIGLMVDSLITSCEASVTITPTATLVVTYTYFDAFGTEIGSGPSITLDNSGVQVITVVATDADGCTEEQTVTIIGGPVDVSAPDTVLACGVDEIVFGITNNDPNDTLTYVWSPDSIFDPTTINDPEPVFVGDFGEYNVTLIATNQFGCADTFEITLVVQDDNGILDFEWEPDCSGSTIFFTNTSTVDFGFVWDFDGLGTSNEANPSFSFPAVGVYDVTLCTIYPDDCIECISKEVTVAETVLVADIQLLANRCQEDGSVELDFIEAVLNLTGDTLIYDWTFDGLNATPAMATGPGVHTVTMNESGELTVTLTVVSEDGCMSSIDSTLDIQLAEIDIPTEVTICPGDSIELNPDFNPAYSYLWSPAIGFDPNDPNPTVFEAGTYSVTVNSFDGDVKCPATGSTTVIIADSIDMFLLDTMGGVIPETVDNEINADGSDILPEVFTCGDPATITAVVDDGVDIIWTDFDGNVISTMNPAMFDPILRDTVIAGATDEFGCMTFDTLVIVNQQVDAEAVPPSATVTVCATQDTFVGVVNNDPNDTLTFMWEDNPIIVSALDSAFVIIMTQDEGVVELNVTVTNQFGCDTVIVFTIDVQPFISTPYPDTVNACFELPTPLNPGAEPIEGYIYTWSPMIGDFSNPANPVVTLSQNETYSVTITDPVTNCFETDSVAVIVAPDLMFEPESTQDTSLCFPDTVQFQTSHGPNVVVNWFDDVPFSDDTLAVEMDDYTVTLVNDGDVIIVYAEAVDTITGCRDTLEFRAELLNFDPPAYPDTIRACFGEDFELNPGAVTDPTYIYDYTPDIGDDANPTAAFENDTLIVVVITDPATGCSATDSIYIDVSEDIAFEGTPQDTTICLPNSITFTTTNAIMAEVTWFDDAPLMNQIGSGDEITIFVDEVGITTIYAKATDPETGCMDTLIFNVELIEFDPNMYPDTVFACFGEDFTFPGGPTNPDYVYQWMPDIGNGASPAIVPTEDGTYVVTIFDPSTECEFSDTIFVSTSEFIDLEATPQDTILCEPGTFTVTTTNSANATITWFDDPELTNQIGSGPSFDLTVDEEGTVTIYAKATEPEFGCMDTLAITATLDILDDGLPDENPQGCFGGDPVSLFPNGINPNYIYTYDPADQVDLSDPNNPVYVGDESTTINVTALNPETGCSVTTEVMIDITDLTGLFGTATPDTIVLDESTTLEVFGCEGDCDYIWIEPNGTIDPNGSTAVATPSEPGLQTYLVDVSSSVCMETVEIDVFVIDVMCVPDRVYLPNAFSPNDDGQNDFLRVRSEFINQIEVFELMIFNRWGQEMYRSFDPLGRWDGTFQGDELEPDVYGYYLRVVCPDGEELIQKGNVTILK